MTEDPEIHMESKFQTHKEDTDEYVMTKYSNKQISCQMTEPVLAKLSSGERLALGITVLAAAVRSNGTAVEIITDPGSIYAYGVPPEGQLVPALLDREAHALRRLGWTKAEADDGWFFKTQGNEGGERHDDIQKF